MREITKSWLAMRAALAKPEHRLVRVRRHCAAVLDCAWRFNDRDEPSGVELASLRILESKLDKTSRSIEV
jgi:hypothetical protein